MGARNVVPAALLAVLAAGCGGDDGPAVGDASNSGSVMSAAETLGDTGPMPAMGPDSMRQVWRRHMAMMRGAGPDSARAMMPRHREMVTRMMEMMGTMGGGPGGMGMGRGMGPGMGMGMDSAWIAMRDSLRGDVERMRDMSPEELEAFLEAHDARMRRMLEMLERLRPQEAQ